MPNLNRHSHPLCPQTASFQLPNGRTPTNLDSPAALPCPYNRCISRTFNSVYAPDLDNPTISCERSALTPCNGQITPGVQEACRWRE